MMVLHREVGARNSTAAFMREEHFSYFTGMSSPRGSSGRFPGQTHVFLLWFGFGFCLFVSFL